MITCRSAIAKFIFLASSVGLVAQNQHNVDSLKQQLTVERIDTVKAQLLHELSREYWDGNLDTSIYYSNELLKLSTDIHYAKGIGNAYNNLGVASWYKGEYTEALKFHTLAWNAREAAGDKIGVSNSLYNIGLIYDDQGNFPSALEYYLKSLRVSDELNDTSGISQSANNVGLVYYFQKNYTEALKYLNRSLELRLATNDEWGLTESYSNIGLVHYETGNFSEAKINYDEALKLRQTMGDGEGVAISYMNYADYYTKQDNYVEAEKYYRMALQLNDSLGYKKKKANVLLGLGYLRILQGKFSEAIEYQLQALGLANELGANDVKIKAHEALANSYSRSGDYKNAFEHETLFKQMNDSVYSTSSVRQLTQLQMQYDFDKQKAIEEAEQLQKDIVARNIRNSILAGLAATLVFSLVVFRQRNKIAKGKKLSDELLLNILPAETAEELKANGTAVAKEFQSVTVLFTDFKNFTSFSENMNAQELVNEINFCYSAFDHIVAKHGIEKIKTIGDAYMCAGGLPIENSTHAEDMIRAAIEIRDFMKKEKLKREAEGKTFFEIRIGCNTGSVVAGIVGIKKYAYDIWGDAVNIAARMESSGETGKINISGSTFALVQDQFRCVHRGKVEAKNKGMIDMYFVEN